MPMNIFPLAVICFLLTSQLATISNVSGPAVADSASGLKKFNSTEEIQEYLQKNTMTRGVVGSVAGEYYLSATPVPTVFTDSQYSAASDKASVADSIASISGSVLPAGYSTTNVQVAGVDEADFVKNDGKYIYIISNNKLVIVDAYPASKAKIVSETSIDGTPCNIFLSRNYVVVFTTDYGYRPMPVNEGIPGDISDTVEKTSMPTYRSGPVTHALVYSASNKARPILEKDLCVDGNYFDSRMLDGFVYLVTREQAYYNSPVTVPAVYDGQEKLFEPDVYYFDNPEYNYVFHTVTSFNAEGGKNIQSKTFLMGDTNTMYVSGDNIYVSYPVYQSKVVPVSTFGAAEDAFNQMTESEKEIALTRPMTDTTRTVIHKLAIYKGSIDYRSKGEVPGTLLNQFSMDEYDGNLRVATTTKAYDGTSYMSNNVYVLDKNMVKIGSLEGIAPDEKIYSARFMGGRLYMVTFRQMDPFFVIDLSNPRKPIVLGELKIPGYSDYLHPYDATHIIGVGKETAENQWGGATAKGVKIALFDVSDVSSPRLVDKFVIGESGTDSEALSDHRAFLFDKNRDLLVIPIKELSYVPVIKAGYSTTQYRYWDGAYVFSISPRTGIDVRGTVTHSSDDASGYYSTDTVRRSLYIGNVLYTISSQKIVMSDLNDLKEPIGEIDLLDQGNVYYSVDGPIYVE